MSLTPIRFAKKSLRLIAKFKLSAEQATADLLRRSKFVSTWALVAIFASACQTLPKPSKTVMGNAGTAQGQWRAKALVTNLKTAKSATLDLDIVAQEPDRLRIEALGSFNVHVASIASRGNEVLISLTREKKFLKAPADRYALARIVPVRVAPSDLLAVLFDRPLEANNSGWKCTAGAAPEWNCQSGTAIVTRQSDEDGRRRFQFLAPEARMDLVVTEAKADTPPGDSAYDLKPPAGFKTEERK